MHHDVNEPISPELVLVDPELATRVRPFAVAGPALPAPVAPPPPRAALRLPATEPLPDHVLPMAEVPARSPGRRLRARLTTAVMALLGAALLGAAFLPPREQPRLTDVVPPATAAPPASPGAVRPPPASTVQPPAERPPLTLAWRRSAGADYYLVEILRGARLVHATSVGTQRLRAPDWLAPGRYTWRVYAGSGRPAARRVQGPLESGWFVVKE